MGDRNWDDTEMTVQGRAGRMQTVLTAAFKPQMLEIIDDSAQHAGHAGASEGGETHYTIKMVADAFAGQSRVARSRAVHQVLAEEFGLGLHALSMALNAPVT